MTSYMTILYNGLITKLKMVIIKKHNNSIIIVYDNSNCDLGRKFTKKYGPNNVYILKKSIIYTGENVIKLSMRGLIMPTVIEHYKISDKNITNINAAYETKIDKNKGSNIFIFTSNVRKVIDVKVTSSTKSNTESIAESSTKSSIESSAESSIESTTESNTESNTESSTESSTESNTESSTAPKMTGQSTPSIIPKNNTINRIHTVLSDDNIQKMYTVLNNDVIVSNIAHLDENNFNRLMRLLPEEKVAELYKIFQDIYKSQKT